MKVIGIALVSSMPKARQGKPLRFSASEQPQPNNPDNSDWAKHFFPGYPSSPLYDRKFNGRTIADLVEEIEIGVPWAAELKVELGIRFQSGQTDPSHPVIPKYKDQNYPVAEKWYRDAAENHDNPIAHYYLGLFLLEKPRQHKAWLPWAFESFTGFQRTTPDEIEAYSWLYLAAHSPLKCLEVDEAKYQMSVIQRDKRLSRRQIQKAMGMADAQRTKFYLSSQKEKQQAEHLHRLSEQRDRKPEQPDG